jgi:hypothetical protein
MFRSLRHRDFLAFAVVEFTLKALLYAIDCHILFLWFRSCNKLGRRIMQGTVQPLVILIDYSCFTPLILFWSKSD